MSEYDLGFAEKLAETADMLDERQPYNHDARRVMVYLSRLSMEIALKAVLEQAGVPTKTIRQRSHNLNKLLLGLDNCEVLATVGGESRWITANAVREESIDMGMAQIPIGELVAATHPELSPYPNGIRYGERVFEFHPVYLVGAAKVLTTWARSNLETIRLRTQ